MVLSISLISRLRKKSRSGVFYALTATYKPPLDVMPGPVFCIEPKSGSVGDSHGNVTNISKNIFARKANQLKISIEM